MKEKPPQRPVPSPDRSSLSSFVSRKPKQEDPWLLAAEFVGGILCGLWIGYAVDEHYRLYPWGLLGGSLMGFIVGIWNVWKRLMRS